MFAHRSVVKNSTAKRTDLSFYARAIQALQANPCFGVGQQQGIYTCTDARDVHIICPERQT